MRRSRNDEEAERWWKQAQYDLKAAEWNVEGGFCDTACFLSQQSAEKALKSLLHYRGQRRKALTHSLVELLQLIAETLPQAPELRDAAGSLDLHYIPARYPNGLPGGYPHEFYSERVAQEAIADAASLLEAIRGYYVEKGCLWGLEEL